MKLFKFILSIFLLLVFTTPSHAETTVLPEVSFIFNTLLFLLAGMFVMFMAAGFCMLESGLVTSKSVSVICAKNIGLFAISGIMFWVVGYNLAYGNPESGLIGSLSFWSDSSQLETGFADGSDWFFQMVFCATTASIVSGTMAERVKLWPFLLFTAILAGFIYPIQMGWQWGGGWLAEIGFYDFAGSTLVHGVGGWGALVGAYILGPRTGKYTRTGIKPIMGHNLPLATIGVFLLWFGWYGFNGGSVLSANPGPVSKVFVTTTLAGSSGIMGAMLISWSLSKKPDLSMVLNGSLAGLVGITAGADVISPMYSIIVGFLAGTLVVLSVLAFDKIRIDDPVGAISVHLICGIWGTVAVGLFSPNHNLGYDWG